MMKKFLSKIKCWFKTPPYESDLFGVNIRRTVQSFIGHTCIWEYRTDNGEEEHGINTSRRFCKTCNREQHSFYHPYGNIRITWEDVVNPENIKLPK